MGILNDQLPNSKLGLKGAKPPFGVLPIPPNSVHNTYSVDGKPSGTKYIDINGASVMPMPSRLDEWDSNNKNTNNSTTPGKKYMDNPPR